MILPDVNVLPYSFRSDSPGHTQYRDWLDSVVAGDEAYGLSPCVLSSLIRIATHTRIYVRPSNLDEVLEFADVPLDQPHCQIIRPGPRHWRIFLNFCRQANATANMVSEAWLAALAVESGCEWITTDRDFSRFTGLRWWTPFS